jgi:hypothetical protein
MRNLGLNIPPTDVAAISVEPFVAILVILPPYGPSHCIHCASATCEASIKRIKSRIFFIIHLRKSMKNYIDM